MTQRAGQYRRDHDHYRHGCAPRCYLGKLAERGKTLMPTHAVESRKGRVYYAAARSLGSQVKDVPMHLEVTQKRNTTTSTHRELVRRPSILRGSRPKLTSSHTAHITKYRLQHLRHRTRGPKCRRRHHWNGSKSPTLPIYRRAA